ncbi:MAG TPA: hypothetical protein VLE96_05595 [Chlamydiales bacterium]|nr:hypothetical protein [Chlamydiales bacterium]
MRKLFCFVLFFQCLSAANFINPHVGRMKPADPFPRPILYRNGMTSRLQWDSNFGYCGEVSLISAGMQFGQYCSQFTARELSNSPPSSQCDPTSQLLLGPIGNPCITFGNGAELAACQMNLTFNEIAISPIGGSGLIAGTTQDFLVWIKQQVAQGFPTFIGAYLNYHFFFNCVAPSISCDCSNGLVPCTCDSFPCPECLECCDPQYDHIVSVTAIGSNHTDTTNFYADDVIYIDDHGIWGYPTNPSCYQSNGNPTTPPYIFSFPFGSFMASREQANSKTCNLYSVYDSATAPTSSCANYGFAITGVIDNSAGGPFVQKIKLTTIGAEGYPTNAEIPNICDGGDLDIPCNCAKPQKLPFQYTPVALRVLVYDLTPGTYNLYQYNDFDSVPTQDFNSSGGWVDTWQFTIPPDQSTFEIVVDLPPDPASDTRVFRCVPISID